MKVLWSSRCRCAVALAVLGLLLAPVPSAGATEGLGAAVGPRALAQQSAEGPVWSGSELQAGVMLGDVAAQSDPVFRRTRMEDTDGGAASAGDWRDYCFELSDSRKVGLGLRRLDRNADLYLLSGSGDVLVSASTDGTASEWVEASLRAGSYCARVVAAEAGENHFVFRYGAGSADPDSLLPEPVAEPAPAPKSESESEPDPASESEAEVWWSGSMMVGESELRGDAAFGFSSHTNLGTLAPTGLPDGKTVRYLVHIPASSDLYLGVSPRLANEASLVLSVGGVDLAVADASVSKRQNWHYMWAAPGIDWAAGDSVEVSLRVEEPEQVNSAWSSRSLARQVPPERSGEATLESLTVYGAALNEDFAAGTRSYTASAAALTSRVTIEAVPAKTGAQATISPADVDADLDGHQIDLAKPAPGSGTPASTAVTVTVTDTGGTTGAYQLAIARASHRSAGFVDLDVGWDHVCALRADGQVVCQGTNDNQNNPRPAISPSTSDLYVDVSAGRDGSCAVRADLTVDCFDGPPERTPVPGSSVVSVSLGTTSARTCALYADGTVWCSQGVPESVSSQRFVSVDAGGYGTACGLTESGRAVCWRGGDVFDDVPAAEFTSISFGGATGCGIKADGSLECWGLVIGGSTGDPLAPPDGLFTQVASGYAFTCGLRTDGDAVCWSNRGQNIDEYSVEGPFEKVSIDHAFSAQHACGLRTDGTIDCWVHQYGDLLRPPPTAAQRATLALASLELAGTDLGFDSDIDDYAVKVVAAGGLPTLSAAAVHADATVSIDVDDDPDTDGHQIRLIADSTETVTVTVSLPDVPATRIYTVAVSDARLRGLQVEGDLEGEPLAFDPGTTSYSLNAASDAAQVTVSYDEQLNAGLDVGIVPADADADADGHQVNLSTGKNTVTVTATLAGGTASQAYTITITSADGNGSGSRSDTQTSTIVRRQNRAPAGRPAVTGTGGLPTTFQASVAAVTDDDGLDEAVFSYQWIGVRGGVASAVDGATEASYVADLTDGFDGYRVRVSYVDDGGTAESLTSATADVRSHVVRYGQALPDLISTAPRYARVSRAEIGDAVVMPADGSHSAQRNDRPMLLLRFTSDIANVGAGPLLVEGNPQLAHGADDTSHSAWQQTLTSEEEWVKLTRPPIRYERADGHNHFHLMRIAEYSLWDEAGEVRLQNAPKVGFCLGDIYAIRGWGVPRNYLPNCGRRPADTELRMGISQGWRDTYGSSAAFQWVDVSDVAPGRYRLGGQVDPDDVVWESDETNNELVLGDTLWTVPGWVAADIASRTDSGVAVAVTLRAEAFGDPGELRFRIVEGPSNGTLDAAVAATLTDGAIGYTPDDGFSGQDTFVYEAFDSSSEFPRTPVRATVTIEVIDRRLLSSLSVSDGDIGAFDSRVFDYSVRVSRHTTMTTITAASDGESAVTFDAADADSAADGHQVSLGPNDPVTVTITVTAPDGITTSVYTVTIRAAPVWQATMTAGEAVNANGYNARSGSITSTAFEIGGVAYSVSEILAWEFMYITVSAALPAGYVFEVNGEQFALSDADADTYGYGTVYYWEDAGQIWARGSQVSLALYPAD